MSKLFSLSALVAAGLIAGAASAQVNITGETAGQGGVPGTVHAHLAEVAAGAGIANIQVQYGQTLTNSVQNVGEGKTDIASAPQILPFYLSKSVGPYAKLGKEKGAELAANLRVLFTYSFGFHGLWAYDSVGLKGWGDIKGRKIYNGPPRGAALVMARQLAQFIGGAKEGTDYTGVQVNWGQDIQTVTSGVSDAMLLPVTFPDRRITAALASGNVTLFSATKEIFESEGFQKYASTPGVAPARIDLTKNSLGEGATVVSEDNIFRGIHTTGAEVVNKSMSFDLAKALTAAYIASLPALKAKAPWGESVGLDVTAVPDSGMCATGSDLKYHPGAVAAWEEAGYTIPDCAKP